MNIFTLYLYFWTVLFGACIGSFLNVVIYRLPRGIFFSSARSRCPNCGQTLGWRELIPIVSYLRQKGRCRRCAARISPRYPLVESACAVLAAASLWRFGFDWTAPLAFGILAILLAVALIDLDTMEIPNSLVLAVVPFALMAVPAWPAISVSERIIGFFAVSAPMLALALVVSGAFGGGDIKLIAVCGFVLGFKNTLAAFFISLLFAGVYAAYLLISGKAGRGDKLAFGPYLCIGTAVALLWGDMLIKLYLSLFM